MAEAAVSFLLEQVKGLLLAYAKLLSEAATEFKRLEDDLKELKVRLKDMTNVRARDYNLLKFTEDGIRDLVYEVEDTIDEWLTQETAASRRCAVVRVVSKIDPRRASLADKVRSLREDKVTKMLEKAKDAMKDLVPQIGENNVLKSDEPIRQEKVVDFADDQEAKLSGYLKEDKAGLDVISIIGIPGLGKTILAWKIYERSDITTEFPIRIWVQVSHKKTRDVFLKIMEELARQDLSFTTQDMFTLTDQQLCDRIHKYLKEKRFLLVLDNIWEPKDWDALKDALPFGNGKAKVLITSREKRIGLHAKQITDPHELSPLGKDESWELLEFEVFGNAGSCPAKLKDLGKYIAKECGGLPLKIVLIGGILKNLYMTKKNMGIALVKSEWSNISKALVADAGLSEKAISGSYDNLPDDLKEPFLYLGVFPDDYDHLPTWTITRLWIAEGFIRPKNGQTLEKTAEENLDNLISRNLLTVEKMNPMGEVKICGIHDTIRAFCRKKALEQKLLEEIKAPEEGFDSLSDRMENIHRLCLHLDLPKFFDAELRGQHVRSFLCFRSRHENLDPRYISAIPESFPSLRILHSEYIRFNQFPQRLTRLIHLRYLILVVDDLDMVPESISQLWNLQTIVVDTTKRTLEMRANIWKMIQLRHFKTKAAIVLNTKWQGKAGKTLQTLTRVSPESGMAAVSEKASNLKSLGIRGNVATLLDDKYSLAKLTKLEKLKLVNDLQYQSAAENPLPRFPGRSQFPPKLKRLTLSNTFLDWEHISTLANNVHLEVLKLKDNAFQGESWNAVRYVFDNLQYLLISNTDLVFWVASDGTFPSLRYLALKRCAKLDKIPSCLGENLINLEIEYVSTSAADSAMDIKTAKQQQKDKNQGTSTEEFQFSLVIGPGCGRA